MALKENLKLQGRVRELESKLQQAEVDLQHAREMNRRSANESQRAVERLETEVRELKFKLTERSFRSLHSSKPINEEQVLQSVPQHNERKLEPSNMSLDYSSQIHELLQALEKAHEDALECRKELKDEQDRSDELLYQLEHVRATCAHEVLTAKEAADAAKMSLASKSEELRILRAKLASSDQSTEDATRSFQSLLAAAEDRAAKAEEKVSHALLCLPPSPPSPLLPRTPLFALGPQSNLLLSFSPSHQCLLPSQICKLESVLSAARDQLVNANLLDPIETVSSAMRLLDEQKSKIQDLTSKLAEQESVCMQVTDR